MSHSRNRLLQNLADLAWAVAQDRSTAAGRSGSAGLRRLAHRQLRLDALEQHTQATTECSARHWHWLVASSRPPAQPAPRAHGAAAARQLPSSAQHAYPAGLCAVGRTGQRPNVPVAASGSSTWPAACLGSSWPAGAPAAWQPRAGLVTRSAALLQQAALAPKPGTSAQQASHEQPSSAVAPSEPAQASETRQCSKCRQVKLSSEFWRVTRSPSGLDTRCTVCMRAATRKWRALRAATYSERPTAISKQCPRCGQEKPAAAYHRDPTNKSGLQRWCRSCSNAASKASMARRPKVTHVTVSHQACLRCGVTKRAAAFSRSSQRRSGLQAWCKLCIAERDRRRRAQPVTQPTVPEKWCAACGRVKPAGAFYRNKAQRTGLSTYCAACNSALGCELRRAWQPGSKPAVTHLVCRGCRREKPAAVFPRSRNTVTGVSATCFMCVQQRQWQREADARRAAREAAASAAAADAAQAAQRAERQLVQRVPDQPGIGPAVSADGTHGDCAAAEGSCTGMDQVDEHTLALLGGTVGRSVNRPGRCAVCVIQRKDKCGTESAPKKCLRRVPSLPQLCTE